MLFNSVEFLVFLPIVFVLYWFVFRDRKWQNLLVVVASYVFYGWWDWRFLLLIAFTSLCSFGSGILLERERKRERKRERERVMNYELCIMNYALSNRARFVCAGNIVLNLTILGIFKYYNFFVENLDALFHAVFDYRLDWVTMEVVLPVGISFYTFQALSYTIDVYRGRIAATRNVVDFFAYISFFPQLVAGPIERAANFLPQFQRRRHFDYARAVDGMRQMLWGLLKKLVVADNCAATVNHYWDLYQDLPGAMLLVMGVLFTLQIYCDFSGYSDMAIGCARLFGFDLMRNFNFPYFSRSIPEFWRRWHISLTTWIRDYVYIPLGGSRCDKWRVVRNVYVVWGVSGLWHGANWTFVCWGLFHASLLAIYIVFGIDTKCRGVVACGRSLPNVREMMQMTLTFCLAVVGWVIFRAESMAQAVGYLTAVCCNRFYDASVLHGKFSLCVGFALLAVEWLQRDKQHALQFADNRFFNMRIVRWCIYALIYVVIVSFNGHSQTFIYFQF